MHNFKSRLTRIKTSMQNLPDGPDLFGTGVDKAMLVKTCEDIYALAEQMEVHEASHQLELIALKRFEARIHDHLKEFLDVDSKGAKGKEKFEDFLDKFSKLYERTKQAYFIVVKDGLREDLEVQALRATISDLKAKQEEYESLVNELRLKAENAETRASEIETAFTNAMHQINLQSDACTTAHGKINEQFGEVQAWHGAINKIHGSLEGWDREITDILSDTKTTYADVIGLQGQLNQGIDDLNSAIDKSSKLATETAAISDRNTKLVEEITNILGDANRVGMAASFKEQVELVKASLVQWQRLFFWSLVALSAVSIGTIVFHLQDGAATWQSALTRFAMVSPLIWLAWFAARQYGFANRVREDYTYKYASAMAYEGYKKAVRAVDPSLEKSLVEVAIMNMAQNPVRLYSPKESDHASPFSELFEKLFGRVKGVKASASSSGVSAEADMEDKK